MENNINRTFRSLVVTILSLLFAVLCFVPVIGPSFGAYVLGINREMHKKRFNLSSYYSLLSIIIGLFIFFVLKSFFFDYIFDFYKPEFFWYSIIAGFALNLMFAFLSYYYGDYRSKNRKNLL